MVAWAVERGARLDVLVNNAVLAGRHSKPLLETQDDDFGVRFMRRIDIAEHWVSSFAPAREELTLPLPDDLA